MFFDCDYVVSHSSGPKSRRQRVNLLADTAIVVLRASRVVGAYEEAWDILRREQTGMPRNCAGTCIQLGFAPVQCGLGRLRMWRGWDSKPCYR